MDEKTTRAVMNAAASSAMEGLPLEERHLRIIESILNGEISLQDYLKAFFEKNIL